MEDHLTFEEQLKQHQAAAKTAILAQCDRLATAGITFVAAHFDGSGDDGVTEDVKCYASDGNDAGQSVDICHPKLVQTGLDLIDFPTILFYETGYSICVLRQASRRSWRIGQRLPVKVKFLDDAETMQESCLRLMGKKLLVSLAMGGKFSSEGLQAINEQDDILMAMARELVTEKGIGERADAVWAALQKKQVEAFGVKSSEAEGLVSEPAQETQPVISETAMTPASQLIPVTGPLGATRHKTSRREGILDGQLTLF